jgi:hypothetical protein
MAAIDELERLEREAFCAPWTYSEWMVECDNHDSIDDCKNPECDGSDAPCTTIESPEEYPDGQIVAQFHVPGLQCLADKNGALIVALRNAAPSLLRLARRVLEADVKAAAKEARRVCDCARPTFVNGRCEKCGGRE